MRMIKYQCSHVYGVAPNGSVELAELPGVMWTATVQGHLISEEIPEHLFEAAALLPTIGFAQYLE